MTFCEDQQVTIHHGDCLDVMADMPESSIDAIVTDPPYGLGFMGRAWDALPPGKEWAEECLRVLKPGGHLLAFGGTRTWHRLAVAIEDAGLEIRDSIAWMHGQGFPKGKASLKPAHEPVVLARKKPRPHEGSLQIDACRIAAADGDYDHAGNDNRTGGGPENGWRHAHYGKQQKPHPSGRWPANVILDEHMAGVLDEQSGVLKSPKSYARTVGASGGVTGWNPEAAGDIVNNYGDSGGASRFFHVIEQDAPFIYCAKAPKRERPVVDGVSHPTTKPLTLMRYLVRMVTPPDGTILDPFAGSGTTIEAAMLEGFQVIGIEREDEYLPLIHERIRRAAEQLNTAPEAPEQGAFAFKEDA